MSAQDKQGGGKNAAAALQALFSNIDDVMKLLDSLPYPVWINDPDGVTLFLNQAGFDLYHHSRNIIGNLNIFTHPGMAKIVSIEKLKRVLKGEIVFFPALMFPVKILQQYVDTPFDMVGLYQDVTVFPVMDGGRVKYIVTLQLPCRVYKGRVEIEHVKEYIENNWFEEFNLDAVLKVSGLSRTHFSRIFKQQTGATAHEYYLGVKIEKLKEKLDDHNLSVVQAFHECNLDYNGHFAGIFKKRTGLSPSAYRKLSRDESPRKRPG